MSKDFWMGIAVGGFIMMVSLLMLGLWVEQSFPVPK